MLTATNQHKAAKISGPAWLSIAANGTLSGTPNADDLGPNRFTVKVGAAGGSDTATLEVTVEAEKFIRLKIGQ